MFSSSARMGGLATHPLVFPVISSTPCLNAGEASEVLNAEMPKRPLFSLGIKASSGEAGETGRESRGEAPAPSGGLQRERECLLAQVLLGSAAPARQLWQSQGEESQLLLGQRAMPRGVCPGEELSVRPPTWASLLQQCSGGNAPPGRLGWAGREKSCSRARGHLVK